MRVESQPAFVLHAQPYRETSLLVEAFTRDYGRIGLVARGVRGVRGQPTRALLQPLQPLQISWWGRGDLVRLVSAESAGAAFAPVGESLIPAFYLNELLVRLLPRGEAQAGLFWRYAEALDAIQRATDIAWELRRFERDLMAELGYALKLEEEADGQTPVEAGGNYRFDPEQGPLRITAPTGGSVAGAALIGLARDTCPDPSGLRDLRRMMRQVLRHHLGGRELHSWQVLSDLGATGPATPDPARP